MLIPSYGVIVEYFDIDESLQAIPDALFVLVSAIFALLWGYYTDRINRSKVIMAAAFSWTIGMLLTAFSWTFNLLIFSRALSGFGLGSILPVGYSIISDIIPPEERSGWFGTIAILSSISNGVGQAMSSFLGPLNILGFGWKFPFLLFALISLLVVFLLFFVKFPQRGASEEELLDLTQFDLEYVYKISKTDLRLILQKNTNKYLIIQGFLSIIPGTIVIYFFTSMVSGTFFDALPDTIQLQTALVIGGMVGIGYILGNLILSGVSDALFRRGKKNRVRLATFCMLASVPMCLMMLLVLTPISPEFVDSLNFPDPIPPEQSAQYMLIAIGAIFSQYPVYLLSMIFALIGSIFSAGPIANRNAVMIDVNLPEHKGTAASFFRISEQVGKGITLLLSFTLIQILGSVFNMMVFAILFWIPGGILWGLSLRSITNDMDNKSKILSERKQVTLIDFIFELEIIIDRAFQKVHDLKHYINTDQKKFSNLLDESIKLFEFCERTGEGRSITNIENKAHILKLKALMLKQNFKRINKQRSKENISEDTKHQLEKDLQQLKLSIDEWEPSSLGRIKTLYDDGYLRVCEARLQRKYNLFKTLIDVRRAIATYNRVELLLKERLEDYDVREEEELTYDEKQFNEHIKPFYEKTIKVKNATKKLEENLNQIVKELSDLGINQRDIEKISDLTSEYEVDIEQIILDTIGPNEEKQKTVKIILSKIEEIFDQYDEWAEEDFAIF